MPIPGGTANPGLRERPERPPGDVAQALEVGLVNDSARAGQTTNERGSSQRFRRRRPSLRSSTGLFFASWMSLLGGCQFECDYHYDCQAQDPTRVYRCEERKCVVVEPDLGQTCTAPADCDGPGNHRCVDGICALAPSCQQLHGDFLYAATCFPGPTTYVGTASASTDDCVATVSTVADPAFTLVANIAVNTDGLVSPLQTAAGSNPCGNGAWSGKKGALFFPSCTTPAGGCDVALIAASREKKPCIVESGSGCDAAETCIASDEIAGLGVCQ